MERTAPLQDGVGGVTHVVDDLIVRAGYQLANYCRGEHLLDFVSLGVVDEGRDGDGFHAGGEGGGMAGGVVAASGKEQAETTVMERRASPPSDHGLVR